MVHVTSPELTPIASSFNIVKQETRLANFDDEATGADVTDVAVNTVVITPPLNGEQETNATNS